MAMLVANNERKKAEAASVYMVLCLKSQLPLCLGCGIAAVCLGKWMSAGCPGVHHRGAVTPRGLLEEGTHPETEKKSRNAAKEP